ncbi:MAG: hypothetical protein MUC87_09805 [Bacteroidia bacterium]|jgi:hypothetical protein|nr:hypothetical protein [Bacteroidia bacterium]
MVVVLYFILAVVILAMMGSALFVTLQAFRGLGRPDKTIFKRFFSERWRLFTLLAGLFIFFVLWVGMVYVKFVVDFEWE